VTDNLPPDYRDKVKDRVQQEQKLLADGEPSPDQPLITSRDVQECLTNNERGDGILYAALMRGRFIYNKATEDWQIFSGHAWALDHFNKATTAVEEVALRYGEEADKLVPPMEDKAGELRAARMDAKAADKAINAASKKQDPGQMEQAKAALDEATLRLDTAARELKGLQIEHKAYIRRIERLRSVKGANNCLTWAHTVERPLACKGDEFDRHPWLLPCSNGVIDLRTGKMRDGKPTDMLMRSIPVAWPASFPHLDDYLRCKPGTPSPCPEWEKFFAEIHQDDAEIIDFHGRYFGYAITGLTNEQYYLCSVGDGANGKGVMYDTFAEVLGPLSWDISPELILEQKMSRNSAGPSADLISLMGRRLVIASETDENRRISAAMIKRLTGQERITARSPHEKYEITFEPVFKLIFRTNSIPHGLTKDFAMVRRLIYIHYPLMYVDNPEAEAAAKPQLAQYFRPKDGQLRNKLRKEMPGILAWLVRECLKYQRDGLSPPDQIRAAVDHLRKEEDHLGRFLEEVPDRADPEQHIIFKELYGHFQKWYQDNIDLKDKYLPSKKSVSAQLVKRGYRREQWGGQTYFYGLHLPYAPS